MEKLVILAVLEGLIVGILINMGNLLYFKRTHRLIGYDFEYKVGTVEYSKINERTKSKYLHLLAASLVVLTSIFIVTLIKYPNVSTSVAAQTVLLILLAISIFASYLIVMNYLNQNFEGRKINENTVFCASILAFICK